MKKYTSTSAIIVVILAIIMLVSSCDEIEIAPAPLKASSDAIQCARRNPYEELKILNIDQHVLNFLGELKDVKSPMSLGRTLSIINFRNGFVNPEVFEKLHPGDQVQFVECSSNKIAIQGIWRCNHRLAPVVDWIE